MFNRQLLVRLLEVLSLRIQVAPYVDQQGQEVLYIGTSHKEIIPWLGIEPRWWERRIPTTRPAGRWKLVIKHGFWNLNYRIQMQCHASLELGDEVGLERLLKTQQQWSSFIYFHFLFGSMKSGQVGVPIEEWKVMPGCVLRMRWEIKGKEKWRSNHVCAFGVSAVKVLVGEVCPVCEGQWRNG